MHDTSAVLSAGATDAQSQRDRHIGLIAQKGRMAWQRATCYGRRSLAETAVGRYKAIIGPKLRARSVPAQQGEAAIASLKERGLYDSLRAALSAAGKEQDDFSLSAKKTPDEQKLTASDGGPSIVVGAFGDDIDSNNQGSAYVFQY